MQRVFRVSNSCPQTPGVFDFLEKKMVGNTEKKKKLNFNYGYDFVQGEKTS